MVGPAAIPDKTGRDPSQGRPELHIASDGHNHSRMRERVRGKHAVNSLAVSACWPRWNHCPRPGIFQEATGSAVPTMT